MPARSLLLVVTAAGLALAGCGSGSPDQRSACSLVSELEVARALQAAGHSAQRLKRSGSESVDQSACRYAGPGVSVRISLDSAPEARRRYFNRVTEQQQFSVLSPRRRPQPVQGLGDEDAYGPAGAYWVPALRQLVALSGDRILVVVLSARRVDARRSRAAAVTIAREVLPKRRSSYGDSRDASPAGRPELTVSAPAAGELVRSPSVVVRGAVTGAPARVVVAGRRAPVKDGIFAREVRLRRGVNRVRVVAEAPGARAASRTIEVRRGRSARSVGTAFARRRPGVVPDVLGERLDVAREILSAAGLRTRAVRIAPGSLRRAGAWAVCSTRPAVGARAGRRRVLLLVDRPDPFRASGTACAQD